jgi:hypothetical protein
MRSQVFHERPKDGRKKQDLLPKKSRPDVLADGQHVFVVQP